jgi:type IV secretion system protein TrbI
MADVPEIREKAPKPPGLVPKHVQTWILVGLAFLMVAIMWLTGGKKPQTSDKAAALTPIQAPFQVNETKIAELQNRIEELQRQQLVAQNALEQQTRLLGNIPETGEAHPSNEPAASADPHAEDPLVAERKRRAYTSLFASNVALSFRPAPPAVSSNQTAAAAPDPPAPETNRAEIAQLLKGIRGSTVPPPSAPGVEKKSDPTEKINERKQETKDSQLTDRAAGKFYLLLEGTILEAVLINRLDGEFPGPIECLVSTDVYSHDRQHLLVPAGSKLLGETRKVDALGQTRLAVLFHRLVMPDGYSVSLDRFQGLSQIGDTGLRDRVNNHYLRIFGVSLAIGTLGAVAEAGAAGGFNASSADLIRGGFAESTAQSSAQILDKFLNILPTVAVREGHRVKVYLSGDLALPDYANHTMPSSL